MVRLIKFIIKRKRNAKRKNSKAERTKSRFMGPNPKVPTWLSLPSWVVKTIVPFPRGNQVVVLQALVGHGKT